MDKNHWDKKLSDYIDGVLPADEMSEVKSAIESDPQVQSWYNDHKMAHHTLDLIEKESLISHLKNLDSQQDSPSPTEPNKTGFTKWWWLIAILISIAIVALTFQKRLSEVEPMTIAMEYSVHETETNVRSTDGGSPKQVGNYEVNMLNGRKLMENGEYAEARKYFENINENIPIIQQNREWMVALTYFLEFGKHDPRFKTTLKKISADPSHNNYRKAVAMEEELYGFWSYFKK